MTDDRGRGRYLQKLVFIGRGGPSCQRRNVTYSSGHEVGYGGGGGGLHLPCHLPHQRNQRSAPPADLIPTCYPTLPLITTPWKAALSQTTTLPLAPPPPPSTLPHALETVMTRNSDATISETPMGDPQVEFLSLHHAIL